MRPGVVRPIAIGIFRRNDCILVCEWYDPLKQQTFYRPPGGTIEFGEYGYQTVARELREEIGAEVTGLRYLGTLENIFTYNGQAGHEIVLVYAGEFTDPALYAAESVQGTENGNPLKAVWQPLARWQDQPAAPLYPDGLLALLRNSP